MTLENEDDPLFFRWVLFPSAFLIDIQRVNLRDLIDPRPGQIIRVNDMDGPAVAALHGVEKFYPIEDEL